MVGKPAPFTADEEREIARLKAKGWSEAAARQRVTEDRFRKPVRLPVPARGV